MSEKQPINLDLLADEIHDMAGELNKLILMAYGEGLKIRVSAIAKVQRGRSDLLPAVQVTVTKKSR